MVETFISNLYSILGALALACIGGYIAWRNNFKSRRAAACAAFRSSVLAALEGLYLCPLIGLRTLCGLTRRSAQYSQDFRLLLPSSALLSPVVSPQGI